MELRTQARKLNNLIVVPFEVSNPPKTFYPGFPSQESHHALGGGYPKLRASMCSGRTFVNVYTILPWIGPQLTLNPDSTQNPPIGYRSVSDTWSLANPVRKVEFELLQLR